MDDKKSQLQIDYEIFDNFEQFGYIPSEDILTTLRLAYYLKRPILIEGPPGTGKTSLAIATTKALKRELIRIQCYEGIDSVQIIGEFNYKKQLLQIQKDKQKGTSPLPEKDIFSLDYFIPRALFKAFTSPNPIVLLIDEIDSADEEFFAFLLEALGENQITIPELGTVKAQNIPIVFMTSNNRQDLPEALRRRALYLYIDFPDQKREVEIVKYHCPDIQENLLNNLVYIVQRLRELDLRKIPSISETVDWANALLHLTVDKIEPETVEKTLNVLIKHNEDLTVAKKELVKLLTTESKKDLK